MLLRPNSLQGLVLATLFTASAQCQSALPAALSVFSNASATIGLVRGWPLLVQVAATRTSDGDTDVAPDAITLDPGDVAWSESVHVEVRNASGDTQNWPLQLVKSPLGKLTIDFGQNVDWIWVLPASATAAILQGVYSLRIISSGALQTIPTSEEAVVNVTTASEQPSDSEYIEGQLALADYNQAVGDTPNAVVALTAVLNRQPGNDTALLRMTRISAASGDLSAALTSFEAVLGQYTLTPSSGSEAPDRVLRELSNILREVLRSPQP